MPARTITCTETDLPELLCWPWLCSLVCAFAQPSSPCNRRIEVFQGSLVGKGLGDFFLELGGVCALEPGTSLYLVSCCQPGEGPASNCLQAALASGCLSTCWCLPVKFAGCSENSCVNGFGGVIKTCYTRAGRKGEECFIFGWELFNFTGRTILFKAALCSVD